MELPAALLEYFLYFSLMSFVGWILETVYRSWHEHRLVNAGFLSGPFVPIYGFGALFIAMAAAVGRSFPFPLGWIAVGLVPTVLEYVVSWLMEKIFGLELWTYADRPLNLNGRICLRFALIWAALALGASILIEPFVLGRLRLLGPYLSHFAAGALASYFLADTVHSIRSVFNFKAFVAELRSLAEQGKSFLPSFDGARSKLPAEVRRLLKPLSAFPELARQFVPHLPAFPDWIRERLEKRLGRRPK